MTAPWHGLAVQSLSNGEKTLHIKHETCLFNPYRLSDSRFSESSSKLACVPSKQASTHAAKAPGVSASPGLACMLQVVVVVCVLLVPLSVWRHVIVLSGYHHNDLPSGSTRSVRH